MESVRGEGKADRKALHVLGILPRGSTDKTDSHESNRQNSLDQQQQQQPRHGGGKILDKVKRRFFSKDGESHDDVSPTSPGWKHSLPNLPFASAEYNGSSSSIDRVSISSVDGMRRHRTSNAASNKASYAFVTKDGRVWILIDVTHIETPYALRREICANLDINDWENATITLAEIGQKAPHGKTSLGHLPWAFESWGQLARMKTKVIADSGSQRRFWWTAY
jgi:mitogen-activated protein kinase kinase kinase